MYNGITYCSTSHTVVSLFEVYSFNELIAFNKNPAIKPKTNAKINDKSKFANWYPACLELFNPKGGFLLSLPTVKMEFKIAAKTHINILSKGYDLNCTGDKYLS